MRAPRCVRLMRSARLGRRARDLRAQAIETPRRLVHARVGNASNARTGARWVWVGCRKGAAVAACAVVGEEPAIGVRGALPLDVRNARALHRRPMEAADAQDGIDAHRWSDVGNAHAFARRPVKAADAERVLDALLRRGTDLLRAHSIRWGADTAALIAAHVAVAAHIRAARNRIGRALNHTMMRASRAWRAGGADCAAPNLACGTRHPRAHDLC